MTELLKQVRLLIAEKLLGWAANISPEGTDGDCLRVAIKNYFGYAVRKTANDIFNGE